MPSYKDKEDFDPDNPHPGRYDVFKTFEKKTRMINNLLYKSLRFISNVKLEILVIFVSEESSYLIL